MKLNIAEGASKKAIWQAYLSVFFDFVINIINLRLPTVFLSTQSGLNIATRALRKPSDHQILSVFFAFSQYLALVDRSIRCL